MIGANVTEMIVIVALRKLETTGHELIKTVHPPTMVKQLWKLLLLLMTR